MAGFFGCIMDSPEPVYAIYQGYSMKESTYVTLRLDPENSEDTLRDTTRLLKSYPADSMLFHFSSKRSSTENAAKVVYRESFFFVLPSGSYNFHYTAGSLSPTKLFFINSCAVGCGVKDVTEGAVKGTLSGDLHSIEGGFHYVAEEPSDANGGISIISGLNISGYYRVSTSPPPL